MPPKRKAKPLPQVQKIRFKASARPGTSPTKRKEGEDWKQSRLAPDIPLHMTTRRAAKTSSDHTSPAAPPSAASGSRRSSLNDTAQQSDFDDEPAKLSRMSTESGSPNGSFGNNTPMNGTQTPELDDPVSQATLQASKAAGKRRRASDDSTQSSKTRPNGVLTRTQSDVSEQQPRRKKRKTRDAPADSADQPPELTDASTAPNSPEQVPDVALNLSIQNVLPANGDAPAKIPKRLPGRRRQPHPDINVEVDLRRQLNLKTSYRSLAKVLKPILDELSNRTIKNLQDDEDYYKKCPEYEPLMAELDQRRDARLDQTSAWRLERIDQLDRVRVAEEHIQKEQYINRFEDLRDDFLQRCYFRLKQIERERKAAQDDATDDEDNVLPPTYTDDPTQGSDNRLGPKFASRSRAYVETDRELENDVRRKRFDEARATFVEKDDDADDSIEDLSGGFARFAGPDRTEAIAHYNITTLADAAHDIEMPAPQPQLQLPQAQIIPNDQATLLMLLADLSTAQPIQDPTMAVPTKPHEEAYPSLKGESPVHEEKIASPVPAPGPPYTQSSLAAQGSPAKTIHPVLNQDQDGFYAGSNGTSIVKAPEKSEKPTPARTTHRIMDMLNNDQDVPVPKSREPQPTRELNPPSTPSGRDNTLQHDTPSRSGAARLENIVNQPEQPEQAERPVDQQLMDALSGPVPQASEPPSPARPNLMAWQNASVPPPPPREADEALRRKDPRETLRKIRDLLDRKHAEAGRPASERSHYPLPDYYGETKPQERREAAPAYDPQHPSAGLQSASDGNAHRRASYDRGSAHWDRDRRPSGSQDSRPSPYQGSPPQPYHGELSRSGPTPTHQSPYALPGGSLPLPPKPPGPPPSAPINFRFAHYDPAPPPPASRPLYQPPTPNYPPTSHPPHPAPPPGPYGHTYPSPYGYAQSPNVYRTPPPLPPSISPYPPLKIHQYGGQPILPASMAPPPHSGPPVPYGQPAAAPAFSPPQSHPPVSQAPPLQPQPHNEQSNGRDSSFMGPQTRPRRQYRSYHAPGTQFRTYNGPGGGRGRGGG